MKSSLIIVSLLQTGGLNLPAQLPVVKAPQPASISPLDISNSHPGVKRPLPGFSPGLNTRGPGNSYEQDRLEVERRQALEQQMLAENNTLSNSIRYDFPPNARAKQGAGYYSEAMQPQTKRQTIVQCLSDLAMGYIHQYGYDPFVAQCVDSIPLPVFKMQ